MTHIWSDAMADISSLFVRNCGGCLQDDRSELVEEKPTNVQKWSRKSARISEPLKNARAAQWQRTSDYAATIGQGRDDPVAIEAVRQRKLERIAGLERSLRPFALRTLLPKHRRACRRRVSPPAR